MTEVSNDEAAMQILLAMGSQGSIRTETLKAPPEADAAQVAGRMQ